MSVLLLFVLLGNHQRGVYVSFLSENSTRKGSLFYFVFSISFLSPNLSLPLSLSHTLYFYLCLSIKIQQV